MELNLFVSFLIVCTYTCDVTMVSPPDMFVGRRKNYFQVMLRHQLLQQHGFFVGLRWRRNIARLGSIQSDGSSASSRDSNTIVKALFLLQPIHLVQLICIILHRQAIICIPFSELGAIKTWPSYLKSIPFFVSD